MIRQANCTDIPRIVALMAEGHARSKYAGSGEVDRTYAKQMLARMFMLHGGRSCEGTWCMVSEVDGVVEGYHLGAQQRIGLVGSKFEATDVQVYLSEKAGPFDFIAMTESFLTWAEGQPRIITIRPGLHDFILTGEQVKRLAGVYERYGFRQVGVILERAVETAKEAA